MIRSELYQTRIDEYENMETAALMLMTSKEEKLDSWTSGLLKKAAIIPSKMKTKTHGTASAGRFPKF